nr:ATP-grasp domain-containing protein [Micromonospora sp. ALFpr18c]
MTQLSGGADTRRVDDRVSRAVPDRAILVIYRPAAGRYEAQFRSVVAAATELGVATVALLPTGQPAAEAAGLACYHADLDDSDTVRSTVATIVATHPVRRIFPLFEGDVLTAAYCRRDHGIPGLDPEEALAFRDKNVMHRRATELGVPVARSCRPDTVGAVAEFAAEVGWPVVVKPYAGWACGDTHRVDSAADLARVWPLIADARHDYRVEEYVRGAEYHVDSLLRGGEVVFEQLSRYTYSVLEFRDEPGGTVSRKHDLTSAERRILAANATVLRGFGMRTGVAHVEFFLRDDGELVFGEAAARAGGGSIVPAIEAGRGINLAGEWCRLELDPGHRDGRAGGRVLAARRAALHRGLDPRGDHRVGGGAHLHRRPCSGAPRRQLHGPQRRRAQLRAAGRADGSRLRLAGPGAPAGPPAAPADPGGRRGRVRGSADPTGRPARAVARRAGHRQSLTPTPPHRAGTSRSAAASRATPSVIRAAGSAAYPIRKVGAVGGRVTK